MNDALITSSVVGMVAVLIGKIIWEFLRDRKNGGRQDNVQIQKTLESILKHSEWLQEIHDRRDEDGVPRWYVPRSHLDQVKDVFEKQITLVSINKETRDDQREVLILLRKISSSKTRH